MSDTFRPPPLPPPPASPPGMPPAPGEPPMWTIPTPGRASAGGIVRGGWTLWQRVAVPAGTVTLLLMGLPEIVVAAIDGRSPGYTGFGVWLRTGRPSTPAPMPATQAWGWVSLVVLPVMYLAILRLTLGAAVGSPAIGWLDAMRVAIRRLGSGLWAGVAAFAIVLGIGGVVAALGFLILRAIPILGLTIIGFGFLVIFTALSLCFIAVIVEGASGFKATGRSSELIRASFWKAIGVCALMLLLTGLLSFAITIFPQAVLSQDGVAAVGRAAAAALASCVTVPLTGAILSVLYLELRARPEPLEAAIVRAAVESFGV